MKTRTIWVRPFVILFCLSTFIALNITSSSASSTPPPMCAAENLSLGIGQRVSPMTQEMGDFYTLTNRGKSACFLFGYPGVSFYDKSGHVMPFKYTRSNSIYMGHMSPKTVVLPSGSRAFFLVAGSVCDPGTPIEAHTIRVYPPNTRKQLIGRATASPGVGSIYYCIGAPTNREQVLDISPITKDIRHIYP